MQRTDLVALAKERDDLLPLVVWIDRDLDRTFDLPWNLRVELHNDAGVATTQKGFTQFHGCRIRDADADAAVVVEEDSDTTVARAVHRDGLDQLGHVRFPFLQCLPA